MEFDKIDKELLNFEQICLSIEAANFSLLSEIILLDSIDSTNTYLLEKAKQGAASGTICLAEQQTAGRGRLGRSWYSPHATNIYCSLLWRFADLPPAFSGLSLAVGVMVLNALRHYGIQSGLQLKWPNDVLGAGRKLAGILLERHETKNIVIGVGLNLDIAAAKEKNWIDVSELTGRPAQRNFLTGLLLNEMLQKLPVFVQHGLPAFLPEWRQYDTLYNRPVTVMTGKQAISGIMRGINEQGELLLEDPYGVIQPFSYGEVSVRELPNLTTNS